MYASPAIPEGDCDFCSGIAKTNCGQGFNPLVLEKVTTDCEKVSNWEKVAQDVFKTNLENLCTSKNTSYEEPECLCDRKYCWKIELVPHIY